MLGLPVAALGGRATPVFVVVIGIALIAAASVFDGASRPVVGETRRLAAAPACLALLVLAGWSLLSLLWTPLPRQASAGTAATVAVGALGFVGVLALPDRMRSANLYPAPIGAGLGAIAAVLFLLVLGTGEFDAAQRLTRCLSVLVLAVWPAVAWLRSRNRDIESGALAVGTALAAGFGPSSIPVIALAVGAVAYLLAQFATPRSTVAVGLALSALILSAPLLAAAWPPGAGSAAWAASLDAWRSALWAEPVRLVTGHGTGSLPSPVYGNGLPPIFGWPLLALWYELGLVGAVALAVAIPAALAGAASGFGPLLPALTAAFATAFVVTLSGPERGAWWPTALAAVALVFVATERGQFRTRRPRAVFGRAPSTQAPS